MNTALSVTHNDAAFFRNRQAMLIYPAIVLPFIAVLFWLFGGGKGERYLAEETAAAKAGSAGFNAQMPNAKHGSIDERNVDGVGYGKAKVGQVLSVFNNTKVDSTSQGLRAIPAVQTSTALVNTPNSSLAGMVNQPARSGAYAPNRDQPNAAAIAATRSAHPKGRKLYYYNAPGVSTSGTANSGNRPYYSASATDQQLDQQLQQYESSRNVPAPRATSLPALPTGMETAADQKPSTVRLSDNLTASRLSESSEAESPFLTAPTGGNRPEPTRAVLSGGNYGQKKVIAWMIPVVVHEDQTIKDGQQVKLRLLKEIQADGVTIPVNTVLYAFCQLSNDRLRLTVQNLQLHGQLIPLDLDVYDTDGSPGINVPGLSQSGQINGQLRSSAIQGTQIPGLGGLANTVLSSARMGASQSARQTTIRLRSGYNLYLKAQ